MITIFVSESLDLSGEMKMIKHNSKALAGLVLLVVGASTVLPMTPTRTISADLFGSTHHIGCCPDVAAIAASGKIRGLNQGGVELLVDTPDVGATGGPFVGRFTFVANGGRGQGNATDSLSGIVAEGDGIANTNGFTVVYFADVTITGGTGRYEGATGTISVTVSQSGLFDYGDLFSSVPAEIILDGQYSVQ